MTAALLFLLGIAVGVVLTWFVVWRTRKLVAAELQGIAGPELQLLGAETVRQMQTTEAGLQAKLQDMQTRLEGYQTRITEFEKERAAAQGKLELQLQQVAGAGATMAQEARSLREALATSHSIRGNWGESVLRNVLAASGLNQQIDYMLQVVAQDGRPDAVVHMPSGGQLAIDAKASLSDFLSGLETADETERQQYFSSFARTLRRQAADLAKRDYCRQLDRSLPGVVMFVPSEAAFRAALDADAELFRYGQQLQPAVLLASPSTLLPLLLVVAHGWQQQKAGKQMQELLKQVAELGKRMQTLVKHMQEVGKAIDDAGKAYNAVGASYLTRLAPQLSRLQERGANWELPAELKPVENRPQLADSATSTD